MFSRGIMLSRGPPPPSESASGCGPAARGFATLPTRYGCSVRATQQGCGSQAFRRQGTSRQGPSCRAGVAGRNQSDMQRETPWKSLLEIFGDHSGDPGHWNFSPEWWGSQGDGWGRDDGKVIYQSQSDFNGQVCVTSHGATCIDDDERAEEWRVLRFNGATRQSVSRVATDCQLAQPECLAQDYMKSLASVGCGLVGALQIPGGMRVLCLGVGGGSLPYFWSHHFPESQVEAVDIDPVVFEAAHEAMGLPRDLANMHTVVQDGVEYLAQQISGQEPKYHLIFLDVFDGDDLTPEAFLGDGFADLLAQSLETSGGALVMNIHGMDIDKIGGTFQSGLMRSGATNCLAFSIQCQRQPRNAVLACVAGWPRSASSTGRVDDADTMRLLSSSAGTVAGAAGICFPTRSRAVNGYSPLS